MKNKELYKILCNEEKSIPLFSQAWWLDATAGEGNWDVALVEEGGRIVASMPYVIKKRYGFTLLSQPALTQTLGPWMRESGAKYSRKLSLQKEWLQLLFSKLPPFDHFQQSWHQSQTNWLPLFWMGFKQTTRYTYVINDLSDLDVVLKNFDSSYRNKIKKASKIVEIKKGLSIDDFYAINALTFSRQEIPMPYTIEFLRKHDSALADRNQREIFYAVDALEKMHSSLYLTWDDNSAYVHMVGEDPELRSSGAGILLVWEAIKYTRDTLGLNRFDFEGSMLESVERVRRDCGGVQIPYFTISKTPSRFLKIAMFLKDLKAGG